MWLGPLRGREFHPRDALSLAWRAKVSAGDVVQQQVVIEGKQLAQPLAQVALDRVFVRQQPLQRTVEAIVIDPLDRGP